MTERNKHSEGFSNKNDALLSAKDPEWLVPSPSSLSSILRKLLIPGCYVPNQLPLALLGWRSPRCSVFAAHPEDHGGLLVVSYRRIKTLGAPVQSSGERKFSLGVLAWGRCRGPFPWDYPVRRRKKTAYVGNWVSGDQLSLSGAS